MPSLLDLPHDEASALLATGAPVYLTVNPVEYHGPHLPLHNDFLVSRGLVRDLHARLARRRTSWPLLWANDLEVGVDPVPGHGSRSTPYLVAKQLVRDACSALADLGARNVVIMTFHGAPMHEHAIQAGVDVLVERGVRAVAPFNVVLQQLLDPDVSKIADAYAHIEDEAERAAMMRDQHLDFHAGFGETSLTLHYAPESVSPKYRELPPCPPIQPVSAWKRASELARRAGQKRLADELRFAAYGLGWQAMTPFLGYTGRPHRATAQAGAALAKVFVDGFETAVEDVFAGRARSPEPIMKWAPALSLDGRIVLKPPAIPV
jgi:creatinine amidohydrolase